MHFFLCSVNLFQRSECLRSQMKRQFENKELLNVLSFQLTELSLSAISSILRFKQWFRMLIDDMRQFKVLEEMKDFVMHFLH